MIINFRAAPQTQNNQFGAVRIKRLRRRARIGYLTRVVAAHVDGSFVGCHTCRRAAEQPCRRITLSTYFPIVFIMHNNLFILIRRSQCRTN